MQVPDHSENLRRRAEWHTGCFGCRSPDQGGLGLRFETRSDGSVVTAFTCPAEYRGYAGWVHGGIVATLLDEAMTECLVNLGIRGITARMNIRYRRPVDIGSEAIVEARLVRVADPLYVVQAELHQNGRVRAVADAKFYGQSAAEARAGVLPGYFTIADTADHDSDASSTDVAPGNR